MFDATVTNSETNGTYCVLGKGTSDYVQLYARSRPDADKVLQSATPSIRLEELDAGPLRASHARAQLPQNIVRIHSRNDDNE